MRRDQYGNVSEGNAGVCLRVWVSIVSLLQVRSSSALERCLEAMVTQGTQDNSIVERSLSVYGVLIHARPRAA